MVDADVAHIAEEGEVDDAGSVLLVVRHQFEKSRVVVAGDGERAVVFLDETHALTHDRGRKTCLDATEVEFGNQAPCHGITMQDGVTGEGKTFEGMTDGVSEIECLADTFLQRVFLHDSFFYGYTRSYHLSEMEQIGLLEIEVEKFRKDFLVADESVLQHFGIARTDVLGIECLEEFGVEYHGIGSIEHTDFVLQSVEVDTRLSSHAGIHHGE